jgi:hypothetical protein
MADLFGLLEFPAPAVAEGEACTDPALDLLLAFMKAALNADLGTAWESVCPADPLPVTYTFAHNPDLESFNGNETPALYVWRNDDNAAAAKFSQDYTADEAGFCGLWVPPPAPQESRRAREGIRNGIKKSLKQAFAIGRHTAWVVEDDTYFDAEDFGSVLLYHTRFAKLRLGPFKSHLLLIDGEGSGEKFKQPYDCLFFTIEALELFVIDQTLHGAPLNNLQGTVTLPERNDTGLDEGATLDVLVPGETEGFNVTMTVLSVDVDEGPAAGGTDVTITGTQFIEDMQVFFGEEESLLVVFVDESTIIARSPAQAAALVDITVIQFDPGGVEKTLADAFTYV